MRIIIIEDNRVFIIIFRLLKALAPHPKIVANFVSNKKSIADVFFVRQPLIILTSSSHFV